MSDTESSSVLTMSGPDRESMYTNSDSYEAFTTSTATRKTSKIDDYNMSSPQGVAELLSFVPYDPMVPVNTRDTPKVHALYSEPTIYSG